MIIDGAALEKYHGEADVVVVGSGAGGANVALRLVELGLKVIVLEYGAAKTNADFSQEDAVALPMLYHEAGMRLVSGDANFPMLGAKTLGGSTVVNSGICFRAPRNILDTFVAKNGIDWAQAATIDPAFDWVEKYMRVGPQSDEVLGTHNLVTRGAYQNMGWHTEKIPRNAPTCVGCGVCQLGCPSGGKYSVDKAQIAAGLEKGLTVLTRARADKIVMDRSIARGVEGALIENDGHTPRGFFSIKAKAVVSSAGAIDTPMLLQRSGLGGIDEGIGRGLKIHPPVGVFGYFPNRDIHMWNGVTQGIYSDQFMSEGMLLESAASMTAPIFFAAGAGVTMDVFEWMRLMPHLALSGLMIHDQGEGTVRNGPLGKALIKYHFAPYDLERLKRGVLLIGEAYLKAGAQAALPAVRGTRLCKNLGELKDLVAGVTHPAHLQLYASHPQATVRMHADRTQGPLSPRFNLHAVKNLFVADASIFPDCLGVNPQITIMAAARLAGAHVAEAVA